MSSTPKRPPKPPAESIGFVSLGSLTAKTPPSPEAALAEIRRIYFKTTRETIHHDIAHAIALLKTISDDDASRDKAAVYMEGLSEMRTEWARQENRGERQQAEGRTPKKRP